MRLNVFATGWTLVVYSQYKIHPDNYRDAEGMKMHQ